MTADGGLCCSCPATLTEKYFVLPLAVRDLSGLFAAADFQWRSVRYLDVHKTDEPALR